MCGQTLRRAALYHMRNRPRLMTYERIASELSSYNVTVTWLHNFQSNKTQTADVDKVQAIYELLSGKKLEV